MQGPVLGEDEQETIASDIDWSEPDNATIAELEKRAAQVQNVCRSRDLPTHAINSKEFFVDHAHNLVWCNIFKAASSFWLYKFNILGKDFSMRLLTGNIEFCLIPGCSNLFRAPGTLCR